MANIYGIQRRVEILRYYAEVELTEAGSYKKGQVPGSYSGSFLAQMHVCYAIVSADATGKILLTTYNPPEVMDKDDKKGMQILDPDGKELRPKASVAGASTEVLTLKIIENAHLPPNFKTHADNMWEVAKREIGDWYA